MREDLEYLRRLGVDPRKGKKAAEQYLFNRFWGTFFAITVFCLVVSALFSYGTEGWLSLVLFIGLLMTIGGLWFIFDGIVIWRAIEALDSWEEEEEKKEK
ncbi:hypothetical protein [Hydrogenivirga sp. 128-5-R1-1]|uniref:hypothetical protein n=1 Tax=Hydrogenivirga sp. 128-5-R1-1 TaxID=392423 RepID=UPI00015F33BB|nr:hypothetical protein [Hydrogenivirga sp. 128-5-R1-1]EDP74809.1 hypothetical protein HG1285_13112 [Hydrogenivirga sp. 128-5-R1-1]